MSEFHDSVKKIDNKLLETLNQRYYHHVEKAHLNAVAIIFQKYFRGYEVRRYLVWYALDLSNFDLYILDNIASNIFTRNNSQKFQEQQ